jgi:hypothetical protein
VSSPDLSAVKQEKTEPVLFNLYGPSMIAPGKKFTLDLWAFLSSQGEKVNSLAMRMGQQRVVEPARASIERASVLAVQIYSAELDISEPVKMLMWQGQEVVEDFDCVLRESATTQFKASGTAVVTLRGLLIASIDFSLHIGAALDDERNTTLMQTAYRPRTAFASYASADRVDVLRSVQGISKGAPDLDIFLDVDKLRSGQDWQSKLYACISTSDIMYLFWSKSAAKSEWVEREWRFALSKKGVDFIDPFPLDSPQLAPPPEELGKLHFNDRYLMFILAQQRIDSLTKLGDGT